MYIQYPVPSVELTDPAGDPGSYLMDVAVSNMTFRDCGDIFTLSVSRGFFYYDNFLFPLSHSISFGTSIYLYNFPVKFVCESAWPYVAEALKMEGLNDTKAPKTSSLA